MTNNESHRLNAHPDNLRIEAHQQEKLIEAHSATAAAPIAAADPILTNSARGNIPAAMKWGLAAMLALAVAAAVAVVIGMRHHRDTTPPAYADAFVTPGGNFILEGSHAQQFGYRQQPRSTSATAISADGHTGLIAGSDPSTQMIYLFEVDAATVPENATLNEFARRIAEAGCDVSVVAYTDPSGSAAHNLDLSKRRAVALGRYLTSHGVDPRHVSVAGKGATNAFGSDRLDRRAELHF